MLEKYGRKINFYGGTDHVGGNAVLFEDTGFGVRLLLDFGINIGAYYKHYNREVTPKSGQEMIQKGLLPTPELARIDNLYQNTKDSNKISSFDGIIISHPHKDHYGGLPFINRDIPVYAGMVTKKIIVALAESERSAVENDFNGINWQEFRTGEHLTIKKMIIVPVHVDHSVPASYGFILYSSQGPMVYTGDFRCHGPMASMTEDFIAEIRTHKTFLQSLTEKPRSDYDAIYKKSEGKTRVLICEGTKIQKGQIESEAAVGEKVAQLMATHVFQYLLVKYDRTDWDRFRTYSELAKKLNWYFIIGERDAYFYSLLNQDAHYSTMKNPNILTDDHILIIKEGNAMFNWKTTIRTTVYKAKKGERFIEWDDLKTIEGEFIMYITHLSNELKNVLTAQAWGRGVFISTSIDPYSEEIYDNTQNLSYHLLKWGIPCYQLHASGHANSHDIINFVDRVQPEVIIPIHTENPEMFAKLFTSEKLRVVIRKQGENFELQ